MKQEIFSENVLPYQQFELLGLSKRDVLNFDRKTFENLLSGYPTGLLAVSVENNDQWRKQMKDDLIKVSDYKDRLQFDAKLQLLKDPQDENKALLILHPVRTGIKNDVNANLEELTHLQAGNTINKHINGERYLLQLDAETNEILKIKTRDINIPANFPATDREKLLKGGSVEFDFNGKKYDFSVDLLDKNGYRMTEIYNMRAITNDLVTFANSQNYTLRTSIIDKYKHDYYVIENLIFLSGEDLRNGKNSQGLADNFLKTDYAKSLGIKKDLKGITADNANMLHLLIAQEENKKQTKQNEADAKLGTQARNKETDLKFISTFEEQATHNLSDKLFEYRKQIQFDAEHPEIVSYIQTDKNRHEFMNYMKGLEPKNKVSIGF
jgi:hypothetical protein